jgi:prophage antirepressor-like protein
MFNNNEVVCPIYYENHFYGGVMPQISKFTNIDFGEIRVVYLNSTPYFCLRDVCRALEFEDINASMRDILREIDNYGTLGQTQVAQNPYNYCIPAYYKIPTEVTRQNNSKGHISTATQTYDMNYIDEPSLYRVIFKSKKPQAIAFQNWVYRDILPKMRQIGKENTENLLNSQLEKIKQDIISSINSIKINNDQELVNLVNNVIYASVTPNTYLGELLHSITSENGYIKGINEAIGNDLNNKTRNILVELDQIKNTIIRLINILANDGYIPKQLPVVDMQ